MLTRTNIQRTNDVFSNNRKSLDNNVNSSFIDVSKVEIDELLCLYPKKERIIKNCKYSNGKLLAELIPKEISYSIAKPDYFTAEQMILAISQMGYLLGGLSIKDEKFIDIDSCFYNTFLEKINNLECFYTRLNIHFIKKIMKCDNNIIEITFNKVNYYPIKERLFVDFIINEYE